MKALLSVSFGTSYEDTRKRTIDVVDGMLEAEFADRAFYSAWTSGRIIARVRAERGEEHDTLEEAFARMSADGVSDLLVATMCFMDGHEMRKVKDAALAWADEAAGRTVRIAKPLLYSPDDRKRVAQALCAEFSAVADDEALLIMGHGSPHASNDIYHDTQALFAEMGHPNFLVGTVEGEPAFDEALAKLEASGAARVYLSPFMMVSGDHANNDLAGDDDDSWKSMLEARGFETVSVLHGLGEYAAVQELIVEHARQAAGM